MPVTPLWQRGVFWLFPAKRTPRPAAGRPWRGASVASGACAKRFYNFAAFFDFTQYRPHQKKILYLSRNWPLHHILHQYSATKKILYPSLTNTKHQKKFLYLPRSWFHIHLDKNNFFTHILTFSRYLILTKTLHQKKILYLKLAITELTKSMFPWVKRWLNHDFLSKICYIFSGVAAL